VFAQPRHFTYVHVGASVTPMTAVTDLNGTISMVSVSVSPMRFAHSSRAKISFWLSSAKSPYPGE